MMHRHTFFVSLLITACFLGNSNRCCAEEKPPVTIKIEANRKRYDTDDTMLFKVTFQGDSRAQIQFHTAHNGSADFHLFKQSMDRKDKDGIGQVNIFSAWELQHAMIFGFAPPGSKAYLLSVGNGFNHQVAIDLQKIHKLQEGEYAIRIGYTLDRRKLEKLIKDQTGTDPTVDTLGSGKLEGAFDGALLSEPITITIGPDKEKKK